MNPTPSISLDPPPGWEHTPTPQGSAEGAPWTLLRDSDKDLPVASSITVNFFTIRAGHTNVSSLTSQYLREMQSRYGATVLKDDPIDRARPDSGRTQLFHIAYPLQDASTVDVRQVHIVMPLSAADTTPDDAPLLQLRMTCMSEVFNQVGPEFARFVQSLSANS